MNSKFQLLVWTFAIYTHITSACLPVRLAGDGRSTPARDTTPPSITCISDIHMLADPTSDNVSVWWDVNSIAVTDNSNDAVTLTRTGQGPGHAFSEGTTTITYHARDNSGNYATCSFNITIQVTRCSHWDNLEDGWKLCNVGYDMRLGTVCEFGCYTGHVLLGPAVRECTSSGEWDISTQPFCQKIQCPALTPAGDQVDVVNISCTNENYFESKCSYSCVEGYDLLPGHNTVQLCTDTETWLGDTPKCFDTSAPVYTNCPDAEAGYAEPSKTSGLVVWDTPSVLVPLYSSKGKATDNSGMPVPVIQTSGPQSGSELPVGEYDVMYTSTDVLDNTATCQFTVFVKQISCPELTNLPYTTAVCAEGRVLGSSCDFSCEDGTELQGPASAVCIQNDATVPLGEWDFQQQPYCESIDVCPTLEVPDNGQLECNTWELGTVCHMTCDSSYLVSSDSGTDYDDVALHHTVLVCGDTGYWTNNGDIPDCQEEDARTMLNLKIALQYNHVDDCVELDNETMHGNLVQTLKDALHPVCQPPQCNVTGIQAICEEGRRKRSHGASLEVSVGLNPKLTSTDIAVLRSDVINITTSSQIYDTLKIDISGEQTSPDSIEVSQPDVQCESGSGYDVTTSKCVKCDVGYYMDNVTSLCNTCPKGYYQDVPRQTECIQCPLGTTTTTRAASSLTQCTDGCAAGFYSETGTPPCSTCEAGSYSDTYSNTECTSCPRSQTTMSAGASSVTECQDFDLVFTMVNMSDTSTSVSVEIQNISTFTMSLWLQCSVCDDILTLTGEQPLMSITNKNTLTLQLSSGTYYSVEDISDSVWRKVTVTHTKDDMRVYIGDNMVLHQPMNSPITENVSSPASFAIGGEGFQGFVSQVQMWSHLQLPDSNVSDTCLSNADGDLVYWGQFAQPEGLFVIANTSCDASLNCSSSPCQNDGSCTDNDGGFTCTCVSGYTGIHCERNISYCDGNACSNNATCIDVLAGYTCECADNFTGVFCELIVVHGGWTDWDISGACSVSCGTGTQQRSRLCENPVPSNGGTDCQGSSQDSVQCDTDSVCVNECDVNPTSVDYGNMNCEWMDNLTHTCEPACHEGYDFDNNIYVGTTAPVCSKQTGYTWNIRNDNNPFAQIPSCTVKTMALKNTVHYSAIYDTLSSLEPTVETSILNLVDDKLNQTGCIQTGGCTLEQTSVTLTDQSTVMFTSTITCEPKSTIDECYNLLVSVLSSMEQAIEQQELSVMHDAVIYHVGVNMSSVDGTSQCTEGYVPVMYYCVPCGAGTYAVNNYCELCAKGYYQDELGLTSCIQCADGFTTEGLMTRDRELCNVPIPDSDEAINWQLFTFVILSAIIGVLLIIAALYVVWDRNFKKPNKTKDAYEDLPPEPETPPTVRFNVGNVWYTGKAVRKEPLHSPDDDDEFPDLHNDSDLEFDIVEEIPWNDHDYNSLHIPETPLAYGIKSPPLRYSSPISSKSHAWK